MTGFTTDFVNQIATNLRDRYRSGFPILKELVQNADDAEAKRLAFGYHPGHGATADHMLLQGPALWVLNDGRFKATDRRAIRSFGLNAKAGDAGAIGKFGLGMKSVFHLCESFFYLACHGGERTHDVLNPWHAEDDDCSVMHRQWEIVTERDLGCLESVARDQPEALDGADWFLLWVPLRQHSHIARAGERPMAAIIERYPGENPADDLDFFSDPRTDQRIGALLPLLRNLKQVRFAGAEMREPFTVCLESHPPEQRLDHETDDVQITGIVRDDRPRAEHMHFLVRQRVPGSAVPFGELRSARSWPSSIAISSLGTREPTPDKAVAEAAVMFAHADKRVGRLDLQWAVFLPAEEQRFSYEAWIPNSSREYRIVLHGQFFVDAGRRGIADMDVLDKPREALPGNPAQHVVLRHWNQALAQQVVLPEFLPSLCEFVRSAELKDDETAALTRAIRDCAAVGDTGVRVGFYRAFSPYICTRFAWVRRLTDAGATWELVEPAKTPLLPIPAPPRGDTARPWRALPGLAEFHGHTLFDADAPTLAMATATWESELLIRAMSGIDPQIVQSGVDLEYLASLLEQESERQVRSSAVQDVLVAILRRGIAAVPLADVRRHRKLFRRIVQLLASDRVFALGTQDHAAKGAIPEALYRSLLMAPTRALPLPSDLVPDAGVSAVHEEDLGKWLDAISRFEFGSMPAAGVSKSQRLETASRIIRAAGDDARQLSFLRRFRHLRVLRAHSGLGGEVECMSLEELNEAHVQGWLFKVADVNRALGDVPTVAHALPEVRLYVVPAAVAAYVDGVKQDGSGKVPGSNDVEALLQVAGAQAAPPRLAGESERAAALSLVATAKLEDPLIVRGVRYLLHGSAEHYLSNDALWKDPVGQNSPWVRLWRMVHEAPWRILADNLCSSIPDKCAQVLNLKAVDETTVQQRLRVCGDFSRVEAEAFTAEEIDLLLGRVAEEHAWRHLPFHRDFNGCRGPAMGECYLGNLPALPVGLDHGVRFIEPSRDADHSRKQQQFFPAWDAAAAALKVLNSASPAEHWRFLMDLLAANPKLMDQLHPVATNTAWLPLQAGGAIAVDSLIRIDHLNADIQALGRRCNHAYASPDDLASELQSHRAYETLLTRVVTGERALPALGQLMSEAGLSIGRAARSRYRELQPHMSVLVSIDNLAAWAMVERATLASSADAVERHLVPEIAAPLPADTCLAILRQIPSQGHGAAAREVLRSYLEEWRTGTSDAELRETLPELRLLSRAGTWVLASKLVAGVYGAEPECIVDDGLLETLGDAVIDNRSTQAPELAELPSDDNETHDDLLLGTLEAYFEPLVSSSVKPAAGAVIGLFGEKVAALAKRWLDPIAYEDYLAKLGWRDPGYEDGFDRRLKWMGNKTLDEALRTLNIRLAVLDGDHVIAKSLTGAEVQVQLAPVEDLQTLFVKTDQWRGFACRVHMRPAAALLDMEPQQQRDVLMRTGESLLTVLYNQTHANLSELFALANDADQVTLDVARGLILEGLPHSLRSLPGIAKNQKLAAALTRLDEARRGAASAKRAGRRDLGWGQGLDEALTSLAALVESDEEVQAAVLNGIRARVQHNQYEVGSIPFEIFQNADDAVIEMQHLQKADKRAEFDPDAIGRFAMRSTDRAVRFAHWGRPVNYAGRLGSYKPEFANDLERMLMLGASAKDEDDGVTGKFGLGFKSVLLVSSTPRVVSGDLGFEVVAGCLPRRWKASTATKDFQATVQTEKQRALRRTVIELPLDSRGQASSVIDRFSCLAGLLPVFSHAIRCVEVEEEAHTWRPRLIDLKRGKVEVGAVMLPVEGGLMHSRILVVRVAAGAVVWRLGVGGIEEFDRNAPQAVPAIWVTAPTRGTAARGILLNARFEIDTGRATLAQGKTASGHNTNLATTLARQVVAVLADLFRDGESKWPRLADSLGCTQSASHAEFWFGLLDKLLGEPPTQDASMDFRLLDTFSRTVLRTFVDQVGLIPNGFKGDQAAFVATSRLSLSVNPTYLASVLPVLRHWERFTDRFPVDVWCTDQVGEWLEYAGLADKGAITTLSLNIVIGTFEDGRLGPEDLTNLASVLRLWPSNLNEPNRWRTEMASLSLRSRAGAWCPATALIRGEGSDERLLRMFAPDTAVLHLDYGQESLDFRQVEHYLPAWRDDPAMIAGWCSAAVGEASRAAVVMWLVRNIYGSVFEHLLARRSSGGWLFELQEGALALEELSIEERRLLLTKLGNTAEDFSLPCSPLLTLDLESISGWWSENGGKWLTHFDQCLWPTSVDRNGLTESHLDRTAWMTLFSLGLFRRYGRVTDQQHRGFLDFLASRGWWTTICEVHPDDGAAAWMDILRSYGEVQGTDPLFELWMDSFPRLYRIARWLETYVHLFQTLDLRDSKLAKFLLSPAYDPSLAGSGIEAPTLSGMLRLGQHLVIRELLRLDVLSSDVSRELAFAPRSAVLELMAELGHSDLKSSSDIYRALVSELGKEAACFSGAYDIPLQLLATNAAARREAEQWAKGESSAVHDDSQVQEE